MVVSSGHIPAVWFGYSPAAVVAGRIGIRLPSARQGRCFAVGVLPAVLRRDGLFRRPFRPLHAAPVPHTVPVCRPDCLRTVCQCQCSAHISGGGRADSCSNGFVYFRLNAAHGGTRSPRPCRRVPEPAGSARRIRCVCHRSLVLLASAFAPLSANWPRPDAAAPRRK